MDKIIFFHNSIKKTKISSLICSLSLKSLHLLAHLIYPLPYFPLLLEICIPEVGYLASQFPSKALNFDYVSLPRTEQFPYLR